MDEEYLQKVLGFKKARDVVDWMLAIDFDPVEIGFSRKAKSNRWLQIIDKSALRPKGGD
jgi:hypothetical protein